ncbi:MAG: YihY family inner membrane protein [Planctomycetota bacterium]|nr:YihY family inner membrane protein [Planctomycetota bacterium]
MNILHALSRQASFHARVWHSCFTHLRRQHAMTMSAALCYRTIFALAPLLLLAMLVLKSMGLVDRGREYLDDALTNAGLREIATVEAPASAPGDAPAASRPAGRAATGARGRARNIAEYIGRQLDQIDAKITFGALGPVGLILLVWTAQGLVATMEDSLNRIFNVSRGRSWRRRALTYCAVVTLGPLLLTAAAILADTATRTAGGVGWLAGPVGFVRLVMPPAVGVLVLAGVYTWLPNTPVRFASAVAGAVATVALWEVVKGGFFLYVDRVIAHASFYGAMGAAPLFLLWLYLSWAAFLLGAQLTAILNDRHGLVFSHPSAPAPTGPWPLLAVSPRPPTLGEVAALAGLHQAHVQRLLEQLAAANVVLPTVSPGPGPGPRHEPSYVLARAPECLPLLAVLGLLPPADSPPGPGDPAILAALQATQTRTAKALGEITLADLLDPARKPT